MYEIKCEVTTILFVYCIHLFINFNIVSWKLAALINQLPSLQSDTSHLIVQIFMTCNVHNSVYMYMDAKMQIASLLRAGHKRITLKTQKVQF